MSAPPSRHGPSTPMHHQHQRSHSQTTTNTTSTAATGIRVVPYTPPRLADDDDRRDSQTSSVYHSNSSADGRRSGNSSDDRLGRPTIALVEEASDEEREERQHTQGPDSKEVAVEGYAVSETATSSLGSALSSATTSTLSLLAKGKDEGVSGLRLSGHSTVSVVRDSTSPTPLPRRLSDVSRSIARFNAAAATQSASNIVTQDVRRGRRDSASPAPTIRPRSFSRQRKIIALNPDKTFRIVTTDEDPADVVKAPVIPSSSTATSSFRPSVDVSSDDRTSTSLSIDTPFTVGTPFSGNTLTAREPAPSDLAASFVQSPDSSTTQLIQGSVPLASTSSGNRMVGGLRRVTHTADLTHEYSPAIDPPLAPLQEVASNESRSDNNLTPTTSRVIAPKPSFTSGISGVSGLTIASDKTNYKVYGIHTSVPQSSDSLPISPQNEATNWEVLGSPGASSRAPSSTHGNWEVLGTSSPVSPGASSLAQSNWRVVGDSPVAASPSVRSIWEAQSEASRLPSGTSRVPSGPANWQVIGASSPTAPPSASPPGSSESNENFVVHSRSTPSSVATGGRYSQESLRVPPLRPAKKRSQEKFGYYKQRSRENLRARSTSFQSVSSIGAPPVPPLPAILTPPVLFRFPTSSREQTSWSVPSPSGSSAGSSSGQETVIIHRPPPMTQSPPDRWSSQLSTVMSEDEYGSEPGSSRPVSHSVMGSQHRYRNSTGGWGGSTHSRQMQSISSSLAAPPESAGSDSVARPQAAHSRGGSLPIRMVRDQDEHGDGIADLHSHPSRSGLSSFLQHSSSTSSGSRNLHSSHSHRSRPSRANSFTNSIPAWARVYYGSGEHRWAGLLSSSASDAGDSRPSSAIGHSGSPNSDNFPMELFSPRKRAREGQRNSDGSMEIQPAPTDHNVFRTLREKTSSIWSPHLRQDRRHSRFDVWDPPTTSWSADSGVTGKRNIQIVLFALGFIMPFAWMIAAFLPLPPNPKSEMLEKGTHSPEDPFDRSKSRLGFRTSINPISPMEEARYLSARWWRRLNTGMSFVGVIIIGAVIALAVIGSQQGWTD
ncbi:hypothetical protein NEUTE1DRAFT_81294 [Neurospora tetrasperma FGSC 2508]|uniref:Serine-rich protein n=1 Tax=Neurospora tetrasperma (strain FGSC 2508 / ATCC MYA-4615 / P0657) TaxID=510951 RepID=F8MLH7_NEUT8|nr:uncharacterized protein NEUTE1DRAFT_81294 [Neurospora tetrasperma FGSC 2508]EGO57599.1 hypothetical protein NEUTE1DRAFT_81294 [Neurospora tetrasperma FGSC 2508]EGZ72136.1 hypothetical protein NEUTE2DRAFT_90089 [Neurospora tetrasperma FGSC 2509]